MVIKVSKITGDTTNFKIWQGQCCDLKQLEKINKSAYLLALEVCNHGATKQEGSLLAEDVSYYTRLEDDDN